MWEVGTGGFSTMRLNDERILWKSFQIRQKSVEQERYKGSYVFALILHLAAAEPGSKYVSMAARHGQ